MGLFSSNVKCPRCSAELAKDAKFCPKCGSPQGIQCRACGTAITPGARFCPKCGRDVGDQPVGLGDSIQQNHWARLPEVFAQRIEGDDMDALAGKGLHRGRLVVEPGVQALIFQKGNYLGVLGAGTYPIETLRERHLPTLFDKGVPTTAILVEEGDLELRLNFEGLNASDYHEVSAELALLVSVKDPEAFLGHLMRGRNQMTLRDLRAFLEQEIRSIVGGYVGGHLGSDFMPGAATRAKIEEELRLEMGPSLGRWGLELGRVRVANFTCPEIEQGLRKPEAKLAIEEEKEKLQERSAQLEQRVRELQSKDFIHKFQTEKDLKDYVAQVEHETGLKNLLRREEYETGHDDFERNELTRLHATRRLAFQLEMENERLKRQAQGDLNVAEFERRAKLERMGLEQKLSTERIQFIEERERALTLQGDARTRKLAEAKNDSDVKAIERDNERADFELSMLMQERIKEVKRREQREQTMLDLEAEERRQALRLEQERATAQLKREYLEAANKSSMEALLATAEGGAGDRLAKHAQAQTQATMSPEQLLALAATQSPEAARALAEKFKAEGTSQTQQVTMLQEMLTRQDRQRVEEADRIERISGRAMDQLGAAAQAGAARPDGPRMENAHLGQSMQGLSPAVKKVLLCSKCEVENPVGSQFCQFCGNRF